MATLFKFFKVLVLTVHHPVKDKMQLVKGGNHKNLEHGVLPKRSSCRLKYREAVASWTPWTSRRDEISSIKTEFIT